MNKTQPPKWENKRRKKKKKKKQLLKAATNTPTLKKGLATSTAAAHLGEVKILNQNIIYGNVS